MSACAGSEASGPESVDDWRPMEEFTYTGKQRPVAVLCDNGQVHAANWQSTRWLRKERRYEQAIVYFDHSGSGLRPIGWKPLSELLTRPSAADAFEAAKREAADAIDFFDRVKASSDGEKIAVGHDHWNRIEAALRKIAGHANGITRQTGDA